MTREIHYQTMTGLANLYLTSDRGWAPQEAWDATEGALQAVRHEAWEAAVDRLNGLGHYEAAQLLEAANPYEEGSGKETDPTRQRFLDHLVGSTKGSN